MIGFIKATAKGIIIGIANIIPGVSGGTMMVSMGVYDTIIGSISGILKHFAKSVKTLLPYILGALIGIVALASVLTFCFDNYPLPTATAFIGLILGGLAPLIKRINMKKANAGTLLLFLGFLALIIFLAIVNPTESGSAVEFTWLQAAALLGVGVIASATMIIPGVSGSMILMLLGYYRTVIDAVTQLKDAALGGGWALAGRAEDTPAVCRGHRHRHLCRGEADRVAFETLSDTYLFGDPRAGGGLARCGAAALRYVRRYAADRVCFAHNVCRGLCACRVDGAAWRGEGGEDE